MKKGTTRSKGAKTQPFKKRESSAALGLIIALTAFNLVYSYAIGMPLPRTVVATYVESVHALGDAQVLGYEATGALVAAAVSSLGSIPVGFHTASPAAIDAAEDGFVLAEVDEEVFLVVEPPAPEPLLVIAPNQISIAK